MPGHLSPPRPIWQRVDGPRILAITNLRHELNDRLRFIGGHIGFGVRPSEQGKGYGKVLLARTLELARRRGIGDILVTCDSYNLASARTIQANGGMLDSEDRCNGVPFQRWWIRPDCPVTGDR